ncbi:MAG: carboxypeptidase regulatory-like domain-containing protein [Candidatus Rokubacteria bacterium]|nr:carboxypeptidase regulatory-like domain-containing protein [Candidatus Rokubacteria bacterium]
MARVSLTGFQAAVGITAGLISILGATYSAIQLFRPAPSFGEVVAIVRDAKSGNPVAEATVEILTPQNALVTTVTSAGNGRAQQMLKEGTYRVRVSHPQFGAEVRQVHVVPGQRAEVRVQLTQRAGGSSPIGQARRAVDEGIGAVERFLKSLGR